MMRDLSNYAKQCIFCINTGMRIVYLVMLMPCTYFDVVYNKVRGLSSLFIIFFNIVEHILDTTII